MRKILIALLIVIMVVNMVGCKKKEEMTLEDYKALASYYENLYNEAESNLQAMKEVLKAAEISEESIEEIKNNNMLPDGSKQLFTINGVALLKGNLDLGPYIRVPNQSIVYINDVVGIKLTKNWAMQFIEDGLIMQHSTGVYGEIVSYQYAGEHDGISCYSEIFVPYLESLGVKEFEPKILFMDEARVGYTVDVSLKAIDLSSKDKEKNTKKYNYTFGLIIANGKTAVYKFFYEKKNTDDAIKELIANTIESIYVNGISLSIE